MDATTLAALTELANSIMVQANVVNMQVRLGNEVKAHEAQQVLAQLQAQHRHIMQNI